MRPLTGEDPHPKVPPYRLLGKTTNYVDYLRTRDLLQLSLFNVYPLHRRVFKLCITELPERIYDFSKIKSNFVTIEHMIIILNEQIHQNQSLMQHFYAKILRMAETDKTVIPKGYKKKYWETLSALLSEHVSRSVRNTIIYTSESLKTMQTVPYIVLKLQYTRKFVLDPTPEGLFESFCDLIEKMCMATENMESFESAMLKRKRKTTLRFYIDGVYKSELFAEIRANLYEQLVPILSYMDDLHTTFEAIIKEQEIFDENLSNDMSFEEGFGKINYFQLFINKVLGMVDNEYFDELVLAQEKCKVDLKDSIETLIDNIAYKLVMQHEWENRDICETFEMLATRAKQIPKTTEELMEMGEWQ